MSLATDLQQLLPGAAVLEEGEASFNYEKDESGCGHYPPNAVVLARDADDVQKVLAYSRAHKVPVVPRGAGSGKSGGALAERGGIVLSLEKMNQILEVSKEDMVAVVQPGVILEKLQQAVEAEGLFYPPDPNSQAICSIGGNLAHNAGGPRALKYGVTRDYVLGVRAVLPTGELVKLGHRSWKGVAGYDLTQLLVGSEGTLAVIVEATLKLLPLPRRIATALAIFPDEDSAGLAVQKIFNAGLLPRACELMDGAIIRAIAPKAPMQFPDGAGGALILEFDGNSDAVLEERDRAGELCLEAGALDVLGAQDESQRRKLWETRRGISTALMNIRPFKVSEDVAVPRGKLVELIKRIREIGEKHGLPTASYGHAGDGNLHANVLFRSAEERDANHAAVEETVQAALDLGGTITGEHGVGLAKRQFLAREQAPEVIALQRRLKLAFDPDDLLNPGKILPV